MMWTVKKSLLRKVLERTGVEAEILLDRVEVARRKLEKVQSEDDLQEFFDKYGGLTEDFTNVSISGDTFTR